MSDPKLIDCPACNAPSLKKQVTAAAFKLKGTGWYETDFKNSGAKAEKKAANTSAGNTKASGNKADSKSSSKNSSNNSTSASTKTATGSD